MLCQTALNLHGAKNDHFFGFVSYLQFLEMFVLKKNIKILHLEVPQRAFILV